MKILLAVFLICISTVSHTYAKNFNITVTRDTLNNNLILGKIIVDGKSIGTTYERYDLRINPGMYNGLIRYVSEKHAVGPFGQIGEKGDFLLEIGNVTWSDGAKRTHLLFHGGNKPKHSTGCIMLGPVSRQNNIRYLPEGHTLNKLRELFYGVKLPTASPNKNILITIQGLSPQILGKYTKVTNEYTSVIEIVIQGNKIVASQIVTFEGKSTSHSMGNVKMLSSNEIEINRSKTKISLKRIGNELRLKSSQGEVVYIKN